MKYKIFKITHGHLEYPTGLNVYRYSSKVDDGFDTFEEAKTYLEKSLPDTFEKNEYTILPVWESGE